MDVNERGTLADSARFKHRIEVAHQFAFQSQARQRRAAQVIEGAPAITATIALQVVGMTIPMPARAGAARASARS
jgi:hypothetical protein